MQAVINRISYIVLRGEVNCTGMIDGFINVFYSLKS